MIKRKEIIINFSKSKITREEQISKLLESATRKEETFRLVAKVISWKTMALHSLYVQNKDKISNEEWHKYEDHILDISKTESVEVVKDKLKSTFSQIRSNQGFK